MAEPNIQRVRPSSSSGTNATIKKDGYARGGVPMQARATKPGKTDLEGYTGPSVAIPSRKA